VSERVVIAMSGGVDSSVAAALLKQEGYEVVGLMLRLWSEPASESCALNRCCSPEAMDQAQRVAELLDFPFYVIDAQSLFKTRVVDPFVKSYAASLTPNPCLECNRYVRWDFLLNKALSLGAQYLATGHYAQVRPPTGEPPTGGYQLLKGVDDKKDQSYVLSVMQPAHLAHAVFPVGALLKPQVRALARDLQLPVAERPESQDLCFLADGDYRRFIREQVPEAVRPGPIVRLEGQQIGTHAGLPMYTIGQRKGIGVAGARALYVIGMRPETNTLVVGTEAELGGDRLTAFPVNWISGTPPTAPFRAQVKIRYKSVPAWATVTPRPDRTAEVVFDHRLRDITPGQAAVFYDEQVCLGGGMIMRKSL
jgi:tRNA-uridine 2-sulfurtransferase